MVKIILSFSLKIIVMGMIMETLWGPGSVSLWVGVAMWAIALILDTEDRRGS